MSTDCKMTINKRKKVGELVAENIDNTAPVQKILEDLYQKNGPAYSLYTHTLKQRRTTKNHLQNYHFAVPGHPISAVSEEWDGQLETTFFEPFFHKSFPPKMINTMRHVGGSDPVTDYLKLKHEWHRGCSIHRMTAYHNKMADKFEQLNDDVVRCPKHLVDMAAHIDSDPDPCFDSCYNWYYAGNGNMQLVCINWVDYLLHSEFNSVYLTELNMAYMRVNQEHMAKFDCNSNIFETICSSHNIVALRMRNEIVILKINESSDNKLQFERLKAIGSELPYTGISFDSYHKNILYVNTLDHKLTIVNLDRMMGRTVKLKANIKTLVDNWNTVISTERGFYTHVGRNTVSLYDKRSNDMTYVWNDLRGITDEIHCNEISGAMQSEIEPILYISTDHHLFSMDLRYTERHKSTPTQRWTHGMQCVPTYIKKCNFENVKDLICLSSQWCEDMCVVPNINQRKKDSNLCNLTIPYRPPSVLKALEQARNNKLCYDLYNPIDNRLHTAITGCMILEQGEKYEILMQNSLGDVSWHTIFPEHLETFIEDDCHQRLAEWSEGYALPKKTFEVSSIVNIAPILKKLMKVPEDYMMGDLNSTQRDKNKFDEKEVFDMVENEEIDSGLLEIWTKDPGGTAGNQTSSELNLHYSDSE